MSHTARFKVKMRSMDLFEKTAEATARDLGLSYGGIISKTSDSIKLQVGPTGYMFVGLQNLDSEETEFTFDTDLQRTLTSPNSKTPCDRFISRYSAFEIEEEMSGFGEMSYTSEMVDGVEELLVGIEG
jgi:hypothetical protein